MAKKYAVQITRQAQRQIWEIGRYIALELKAPKAARRLLDLLEKEISSFSQFPNRIPLPEEEPWHTQGIHKMGAGNYLVYFWNNEAARQVQVTAVIHGRLD